MEVSSKTIDKTYLVSFLRDTYHLNSPFYLEFLRTSFNDHYILWTPNQQFVLRLYLNGKHYIHSSDDIRFELNLLQYLYLNDVDVIPPIVNRYNQNLSEFFGNGEIRYLALFPYAAGKPINQYLTKEQAIKLGELIGKLHLNAQQFSRHHLNVKSLIEDPLQHIENYTEMFGLGKLTTSKRYLKILMERLNELPRTNQAYGIIHGDPNPSNFYFCEEKGFSIFDFDHCAYGYRIHDLAVIKLSFPEKIYNFIQDGYEHIRPLQTKEKNFIKTYSDILLIKKFKDIFNMLEITDAGIDKKRRVTLNACNTIERIINFK
jgi:Ser/Thr protein kinase RdoA (MazF antagonist)